MENLKKEAYQLRMTPGEKSAMRARLFGAPAASPAPSPYFFLSFQFYKVGMAALVLVVFVGGGTAAAAEGALPGDALYPVKIYVNEAVTLSLATTPAAKAEAHAALAERRITEAQSLAAEGRLDEETTESLALGVETHVAAAEAEADLAEGAKAGAGREVKAKLAAVLDTNARVLARLGESGGDDTRRNSGALSARVIARAEGGAGAQARTMAKGFAADASITTMSLAAPEAGNIEGLPGVESAAALEADAAEALAEARALLEKVAPSLDEDTTEDIEEELSTIETSMSLGSASLGAGSTEQALADFTDALTRSTKLHALLKAHQKFDGDLIAPLLKDEHYEGDGHDHGGTTDPTTVEILVPTGTDVHIQILRR